MTNICQNLWTCYCFLFKKELNFHFLNSPIFGYCLQRVLPTGCLWLIRKSYGQKPDPESYRHKLQKAGHTHLRKMEVDPLCGIPHSHSKSCSNETKTNIRRMHPKMSSVRPARKQYSTYTSMSRFIRKTPHTNVEF